MRLFTAIDLPEEIKAKLASLVGRLRPLANLRWSPVGNLHVTTKFIGEWPELRLEEMHSALANIGGISPFEIAVRGLGWFPNGRHPRVFWAGVEGGEPLQDLAAATEQAAADLGVPIEDRPYQPHLTLARVKDRVSLEAQRVRRAPPDQVRNSPRRTPFCASSLEALERAAATEATEFGSFRARAQALYLSAGGKYTKLHQYPFLIQ